MKVASACVVIAWRGLLGEAHRPVPRHTSLLQTRARSAVAAARASSEEEARDTQGAAHRWLYFWPEPETTLAPAPTFDEPPDEAEESQVIESMIIDTLKADVLNMTSPSTMATTSAPADSEEATSTTVLDSKTAAWHAMRAVANHIAADPEMSIHAKIAGEVAVHDGEGAILKMGLHHFGEECNIDLHAQAHGLDFDYVCDETVPWLYYKKGSTWAMATPPPGSGCHSYVFLAKASLNTSKASLEDCELDSVCFQCGGPHAPGQVVYNVHFEGDSCSYCHPPTTTTTPVGWSWR